ncbi:unnamed protein product [Diplocarpon coronariae]|uniref:Transcription factor TFIIIC triple barrel domain-containing protein n=1 Tax=Diplocarpon coronariae TaxID=2795749 RepID=A0A218ZAP3_9HELO|nr:hypothetical protein JHW43_006141 [Diplocarpon mali]OWP05097.1 hypothetical protein B2J93_8310 [Marssonina coronariae]
MAEFHSPSMALDASTPQHDPSSFSRPIPTSADVENEDEWEYEYSTTETEIFYVTLDLTTPDFPGQPRQLVQRDTKKPRYSQPGLGNHKRTPRLPEEVGLKAATVLTIDGEEQSEPAEPEQDGEAEGEAREDFNAFAANSAPEETADGAAATFADENGEEDEESGEDTVVKRVNVQLPKRPDSPDRPQAKEEPQRATEVQILDIHTTKPLVSYDGHVFACRWSENIGTELLFTHHDPTNSLPKLRTIGRVDILAASSARITSTSVRMERKATQIEQPAQRGPKPKSQISRGVSEARNTQAAFLEKLMQIKEDAGDEDNVTVYVTRRLTNAKWKAQMKALRTVERERLNEIVKCKRKNENSLEVYEAKARLAEMDEEDAEIKKLQNENPDKRKKRKASKLNSDGSMSAKKPNTIDWSKSVLSSNDFINGMDVPADKSKTSAADAESIAAGSPDGEYYGGTLQYGSPEGVRFEHGEFSDEDAPGEEDDTHLYGY